MSKLIIRGTILSSDGQIPQPDLRVEVWDKDAVVDDFLAQAFTDEKGDFRVEIRRKRFRIFFFDRDPDLFFKVYRGERLLVSTENSVLWNVRSRHTRVRIDVPGSAEPAPAEPGGSRTTYRVAGVVRRTSGHPLSGAKVAALAIGVSGETPLGKPALTDSDGKYSLSYPASSRVDLQLVVTLDSGELGRSELMLNVADELELDVWIGEGEPREIPAFAAEERAMRAVLEREAPGRSLTDLSEAQRKLVALKAGLTDDTLAQLVTAGELSRQTGIDAEVFYALARVGFSLELSLLIGRSRSELRDAIARAARSSWIDPAFAERADALAATLHERSIDAALKAGSDGTTAPDLTQLLATAAVPPAEQRALLQAISQHEGPLLTLIDRLEQAPATGVDAEALARVRTSLQLYPIALGHFPMVQALAKSAATPTELAKLDRADFQKIIDGENVGSPEGVGPGEYARALDQVVELAFPTPSFAHRLAKRASDEGARSVASFLLEHRIELQSQPLFVWLHRNPQAADGLDAELLSRALSYERAFRMAPNVGRSELAVRLVESQLASPALLHQMGRAAALRRLRDAIGVDAADTVFENALGMVATDLAVRLANSPRLHTTMAAISLPPLDSPELPAWSELLGSLDHCSCEHCASALSPAAYLFDLLGWLRGRGFDALIRERQIVVDGDPQSPVPRRPDIERLKLDCTNTFTPLPYLDLVNEQLEQLVVTYLDAGASAPAPLQYQTTLDAAELLLHPENSNARAYELLANQALAFPFNLPFDLRFEEARAYLNELGVSRVRLLLAFHTEAGARALADRQVTTALLGITSAQRRLIEQPAGSQLAERWGITGAAADAPPAMPETDSEPSLTRADSLDDLTTISRLLGHAGVPPETPLSYARLTELLRCQAVRGGRMLAIEFEDLTCSLDDARLGGWGSQSERDDVLGRLQRFIRLAAKVSWTSHELDRALRVLSAGSLDDPCLTRLAHAMTLAKQLERGPLEVLAFWGDLDTTRPELLPWREDVLDAHGTATSFRLVFGDVDEPPTGPRDSVAPSFFEQLVGVSRNAELDASDPRRALQLRGADLRAVDDGLTIVDRQTLIASTLGIEPADVLSLLDTLNLGTPAREAPLDLASFSALYRYALLARSFRLSVGELLTLLDLRDSPPDQLFALDATAELLSFTEQLRTLARSPVSVADLAYLLRGRDTDEVASLRPAWGGLLLELRDALQRTDAEGMVASSAYNADTDRGASAPLSLDARRRALVVQRLADALELPVTHVRLLLSGLTAGAVELMNVFLAPELRNFVDLPNGATPSALELPAQFAALEHLYKVALLIRPTHLEPAGLEFLLRRGASQGLLTPHDLAGSSAKLEAWLEFQRAALLDRSLGGELFELLEQAQLRAEGSPDALPHTDALAALASAGKWSIDDVSVLSTREPFRLPPDGIWSLAALARLAEVAVLARDAGVDAVTLEAWATPPTGTSLEASPEQVGSIIQAARQRRGSQWTNAGRAARDQLRELQRDALVSALIGKRVVRNTYDLFGHLLLDVEMSPCQLTSRLKQAISSVQLFVQRAFLDLEPGAHFSQAEAREWEWRKNYRVWEANRKIFLHAENWLDPEYRHDKTPFFEKLESQLLQGELDEEAVERALRGYVAQLEEVASLEIAATCEEVGSNGVHVQHVVGRTRSRPRKYFYRRRVCQTWEPWEALDVGIEGEHLLAAVFRDRLHLYWLQLTNHTDETSLNLREDAAVSAKRPVVNFQAGVSWTRRDANGWLPRQSSTGSLVAHRPKANEMSAGPLLPVHPPEMGVVLRPVWPSDAERLTLGLFTRLDNRDYVQFLGGSSFVHRNAAVDAQRRMAGHTIGATYSELSQLAPGMVGIGEIRIPSLSWALGESEQPYVWVHETLNSVGHESPLSLTGRLAFFYDLERTYLFERTEGSSTPLYATGGIAGATNIDLELSSPFIERRGQDLGGGARIQNTPFKVAAHYHPFATLFGQVLDRGGSSALYDGSRPEAPESLTRQRTTLPTEETFARRYQIQRDLVVRPWDELPDEGIDFSPTGAYSLYNWELFFHIPLLVAERFRKSQQFERARDWYHNVFDPRHRAEGTAETKPSRYWKFGPFYDLYYGSGPDAAPTRELLALAGDSSVDPRVLAELGERISNWLDNPFAPHAVANVNPSAYQRFVVMRYCDNLIDWGDLAFRQETLEGLNEAAQYYLLAAEILGRRPELVEVTSAEPETSEALFAHSPDGPSVAIPICTRVTEGAVSAGLLGLAHFCTPVNQRLIESYWDKVADRLFKIRHCLDLEGRFRQLPLFAPPIDPGALLRARAAGVDFREVLAEMTAPPPHYRYEILIQRALELCGEVRNLGAALLSAMEKRDAEALARKRTGHDIVLAERAVHARELQLRDAQESAAAVERNQLSAFERARHYHALLHPGESVTLGTTELLADDAPALFDVGLAIPASITERQYESQLSNAADMSTAAQAMTLIQGVLAAFPDFDIGVHGWAGSPKFSVKYGGAQLGAAMGATAEGFKLLAELHQRQAERANRRASLERRREEWQLQGALAARDYQALSKQLAAANLRCELAVAEQRTAEIQQQQQQELRTFLESQKFSNQELYQFQIDRLTTLYFQTYQLAFNLAKQAEGAWQRELGIDDITFLSYGYWDQARAGLLAGERLHHDLLRMQSAHLEHHGREAELSKHVSLRLLNPLALNELRTLGRCVFHLPEALFDLDTPGHYFRRIRQLSVSIPAVAGPLVPVRATLRHLGSEIRLNPTDAEHYPRDPAGDARFRQPTITADTIVTSRGVEDSGMFDGGQDGRYLPFEGAGAISSWELRLPDAVRQFDYQTITDAIIHLRYTARLSEDARFAAAASDAARDRISDALIGGSSLFGEETGDPLADEARVVGAFVSFSLRQDFPDEWQRWADARLDTPVALTLDVRKELLPYYMQVATRIEMADVQILALPRPSTRDASQIPALDAFFRGEPSRVTLVPAPEDGFAKLLHGMLDMPAGLRVLADAGAHWPLSMELRGGARETLSDVLLVCRVRLTL